MQKFFFLFLLLLTLNVNFNTASAYESWQYPFIIDTKRAYLYLDYTLLGIEESELPSGFHRGNIKKLMQNLFEMRFSPEECARILIFNNPYFCNNQDIKFIPDGMLRQTLNVQDVSFATKDELTDPGTIFTILRVRIVKRKNMDQPMLIYSVLYDRPDKRFPIDYKVFTDALILTDDIIPYDGSKSPREMFNFGLLYILGK